MAGSVERNINFETTKLKVHRGNSSENVHFPPTNSNSVRGSRTTCAFFRNFCFVGMCETVQRGDNAALHGTCALCDIPTRFEPCQKNSKNVLYFVAPGQSVGCQLLAVGQGGLEPAPRVCPHRQKRRPRQHRHGDDYWKLFYVTGAIPSRRFQKDETVMFARCSTLDTTPFCKSHRRGCVKWWQRANRVTKTMAKFEKNVSSLWGDVLKIIENLPCAIPFSFFPGQMTVLCCAPLPLLQTTGKIEFSRCGTMSVLTNGPCRFALMGL